MMIPDPEDPPGKVLICRCEDVTLADVEEALARGFLDIEEVKRYTGLGTGPCQGRECLVPACALLHEARAADPGRALRQPEAPGDHPFTARPPLFPVTLGLLAGPEADPPGTGPGPGDEP